MPTRIISQQSKLGEYNLKDVLAILHSPSSLIELNPLVISHSLLPSDQTTTPPGSSRYTVTDSIPSILSFLPPMSTTYTAMFSPTATGMKTHTFASMGIETIGEWKFDNGRVIEEGSITAPFYLIHFVENQWRNAHVSSPFNFNLYKLASKSRSRKSSATSLNGGGFTNNGEQQQQNDNQQNHLRESSGTYQPIEQPRTEDSFCFANSFWATADRKRPLEGNLVGIEIAKDGYDTLMNRMKAGTKTLEELRGVHRERSALEEEYSKKLYKLAKNPVGASEVGHMERAIGQMKTELETMGKAHSDLAALLRSQDNQLAEFVSRRDGGRKLQQTSLEKAWKNKCSQEAYVSKAKQKYESDAMTINTMHAQAALIQGRDLDKLQAKLDKTVQTVGMAEKEYGQFVKVLKETTNAWNEQWRVYCNTCQDQEEERLDFLKSRLWDWANALSTVAMSEDESAERTRTALEQCDPRTDLKIFVSEFGTGHDIPDAPVYVDFGRQQTATVRQTYKTANFSRSSARGGNLRHSPSGIDEIQRAFQSVPTANVVSESRSRSRSPEKPQPGGAIAVSVAANSMESTRPFSNSNSQSNFSAPPASPPKVEPNSLSSRGSTTFSNTHSRRDGSNTSTSRFVVSPSANPAARATSDRAPGLPPKQGVAPASLFQRGQAPPSDHDNSSNQQYQQQQESRRPSIPPVSEVSAPIEDEDDDPITRAFNQLNSDISPPRAHRPSTGAVALPGMTNTVPRHSQQQSVVISSRQSQPNLNNSRSTEFNNNTRSTSPSPALMQPPHHDDVPAVVSNYGQAFPGERNEERSTARPHSRQGSNASNQYSNTSTNLQSPGGGDSYGGRVSPTPFAGVGARGRSPSPQPFQQSPSHRAPSPQPQSTTNYQSDRRPSFEHRYSNQQQQQSQAPPSQVSHIASPSNDGQHRGSSNTYRSPSPAYEGERRGSSSTYRPTTQGTPSHAPQNYAQPPAQTYGHPPIQQGYQPPVQTYQASPSHQYSTLPHQQQQPPRQPSPSPSQYRQPSPSQHYQQSPQPVSSYQHQQQQQSAYAPPPQQQQQQQHQQQQPQHQLQQHPQSMIRVASANSAYGGVYNPPQPQQQPQQQQQVAPVVAYAPSPASSYAPSRTPSTASSIAPGAAPPPTGQYTEDGRPILFYVNAIYPYVAAGPDEFSFSEGDVIAVTATDPDGWWHGTPVGLSVPGQIFPSNFTEILP